MKQPEVVNMTDNEDKRPKRVFKAGAVVAAVFQNKIEKNGEEIFLPSVRVQKRIKDKKTGEWRSIDSYGIRDIPNLKLVVDKDFEYLALKREKKKEKEKEKEK